MPRVYQTTNEKKIRALMIWNGIRQVDIARACKVSGTSVQKVIAGRPISKRIRAELAKRLGRKPEQLWPVIKTSKASN